MHVEVYLCYGAFAFFSSDNNPSNTGDSPTTKASPRPQDEVKHLLVPDTCPGRDPCGLILLFAVRNRTHRLVLRLAWMAHHAVKHAATVQ